MALSTASLATLGVFSHSVSNSAFVRLASNVVRLRSRRPPCRLEYGDDIERLATKAARNVFASPDLLKPASGPLGHLGGFRHKGRLLGVQSLGLSD